MDLSPLTGRHGKVSARLATPHRETAAKGEKVYSKVVVVFSYFPPSDFSCCCHTQVC